MVCRVCPTNPREAPGLDPGAVHTTDTLAGEGAETVLAREGYGDSVTFVNGFRFLEDLVSTES